MTNEVRVAHQHLGNISDPVDPVALEIPSIEISELGLTGFNAAQNRTALGIAVNIPQFRYNDTYQFQNTFTWVPGNHALKVGMDFRHIYVKSWFVPTVRGRLSYPTLQRYIDDNAEVANINKPLPGGQEINYYEWNDMFLFVQDEWRVKSRPDVVGRDSVTSCPAIRSKEPDHLNADRRRPTGTPAFALTPVPKRDTNNFQPRLGFNWNPQTSQEAARMAHGWRQVRRPRRLRADERLCLPEPGAERRQFVPLRGRDQQLELHQRLHAPARSGSFRDPGPNQLTRTVVADDFRAPEADQYSLEFQRELTGSTVFRVGYVGTQGRGLYQTLDGNPRQPFCGNPAPRAHESTRRGIIRLRANAAESIYHSLQTGLENRLSSGLSAGAHYTWSKFIDDASEPSTPRALRWPSRRIRSTSTTTAPSRPTIGRTASRRTSSTNCRSRGNRTASSDGSPAAGRSAAS